MHKHDKKNISVNKCGAREFNLTRSKFLLYFIYCFYPGVQAH